MAIEGVSEVSRQRLESVGWGFVFTIIVAGTIPWFLWDVEWVIGGLPIWLWWHAGWMVFASVAFWVFAQRGWGLWIDPRDDPGVVRDDGSVPAQGGSDHDGSSHDRPGGD